MLLKLNEKNKFLVFSFAGHLGLLLIFLALNSFNFNFGTRETSRVEFEISEKLDEMKPARLVKENENLAPQTSPQIKPQENARKVYGIKRQALTSDIGSDGQAEVKTGNTLAKENDNEVLNEDDPDSVGVDPVEEFLVSQLPKVERDFQVPYPAEAKAKGLEGAVTLDLLVDAKGAVRQAKIVSGPGSPLNEAALEAVKQILFSPARVGQQQVAVRIRYVYRFVLEN